MAATFAGPKMVAIQIMQELLLFIYHLVAGILASLARLCCPTAFFKDITGDIVLVTGGGSGLGRLLCQKLSQRGATIVTWDINAAGNKETVELIKEAGGKAFGYIVDISDRHAVYKVADRVRADVGDVTILVNNAGIVTGHGILDSKDTDNIKTFQVNVFAHFWTIKAFLPAMISGRRGHIVSVASLAGYSGSPRLIDYSASKFAAVGLDESLRVEMFMQGHSDYIKTSSVCPYFIDTGMFAGVQSRLIAILQPEHVAETAVQGILHNKEVILIPGWVWILMVLKSVMSSTATIHLGQAFGLNCSMDQFRGREKKC